MPRTAPVSLAASIRSALGVAAQPVGLVVGVAVAGDDVERRRAVRRPASATAASAVRRPRGRVGGRPGPSTSVNTGGATAGGPGSGGERLGRDVCRFAADAELIADDERDSGAEGEEDGERHPDEHRSSGVRLHDEQRNKSGSNVPVNLHPQSEGGTRRWLAA